MEAREQIQAALETASKGDKRVLVVFGADWCPDSHALDRAFEHPLVRPLLEQGFEVVPLDVGNRDRHLDLLAEYGMDVWGGIPAVAVLNPDGTLHHAQRDGELGAARSLPPLAFAEMLHGWLPTQAKDATASQRDLEP
jgi:protein disulfide-isomerase